MDSGERSSETGRSGRGLSSGEGDDRAGESIREDGGVENGENCRCLWKSNCSSSKREVSPKSCSFPKAAIKSARVVSTCESATGITRSDERVLGGIFQ
jgi:hypothetical protein